MCPLTDHCGWTPDLLHAHFLVIMDERDRRIAEQFNSMNHGAQLLAQQLVEYKTSQNEWARSFRELRGTYVTADTWDAKHQQLIDKIESEIRIRDSRIDVVRGSLEEKIDQGIKTLSMRIDAAERERNPMNNAVTELKSRIGYIPTSMILASISMLMTIIALVGTVLQALR